VVLEFILVRFVEHIVLPTIAPLEIYMPPCEENVLQTLIVELSAYH